MKEIRDNKPKDFMFTLKRDDFFLAEIGFGSSWGFVWILPSFPRVDKKGCIKVSTGV